MTASIPWWRPLARFRARRAAERAELEALRVAVNELVARTVRCESGLTEHGNRLDQHVSKTMLLARTLQPIVRGHAVQILEMGWRVAALRGVGSTTRRTEIDRLYEQAKADWAARNVPAPTSETTAAPPSDESASAAAIDDLADAPQEARG